MLKTLVGSKERIRLIVEVMFQHFERLEAMDAKAMIVTVNCYFQHTWGWNSDCGTFDWHPEFDKPLGAPKGDTKRDCFKYTREFEHASVFVDLEKKTAKIDWK